MYASIIFAQGDEAREIVDRLERVDGVVAFGATDETISETVDYLSQWDFGDESEHDVTAELGAGTHDRIETVGDYILTWNLGLGYVGLARKLS